MGAPLVAISVILNLDNIKFVPTKINFTYTCLYDFFKDEFTFFFVRIYSVRNDFVRNEWYLYGDAFIGPPLYISGLKLTYSYTVINTCEVLQHRKRLFSNYHRVILSVNDGDLPRLRSGNADQFELQTVRYDYIYILVLLSYVISYLFEALKPHF